MDAANRRQWLWILLGIGLGYFAIALVTASLAQPPSGHTRAWRLAAWVTSFVIFALHTRVERIRLRSPAVKAAWHAAFAAGLGAFLVAVVAVLRGGATPEHQGARALALVVFPLATMLPAFLAAFGLATTLWSDRRIAPTED
jgi:hypothetical protein